MWAMHRTGELNEIEIEEVSSKLVSSAGSCGAMETASTMALMTETLGIMLPGGAAIPAVLGDRYCHAELTGARAVEIAEENLIPDKIMTAQSIANSLRILHAIGGGHQRPDPYDPHRRKIRHQS